VPDKRQYATAPVSFPCSASRFKDVSASEIAMVSSVATRGHGDVEAIRSYEAQGQCGVAGAVEISSGEIREVSRRPGRLLTPPFGLFLRAALLAHLERTFR
jgi:hypothetical protein